MEKPIVEAKSPTRDILNNVRYISPGRTDDIQTTADILRDYFNIDEKLKSYLIDSTEMDAVFGKLDFTKDPKSCGIINIEEEKHKITKSVGIIREKYGSLVSFTSPYDNPLEFYLFTDNLEEALKHFYYENKTDTIESVLKYGTYEIKTTPFGQTLVPIVVNMDTKPVLNNDIFQELDGEIKSFHNKEKVYKDHKLDYKRGILLYGPPGTGKTSLVKYFLSTIKDSINIICNAKDMNHIDYVKKLLCSATFKNTKKIIVFEDIDGIDSYNRSKILNMFDGVEAPYNVVFIATTNYPEHVDAGLKNRPSRFDTFYKIDMPNETARVQLIKLYLGDLDIELVKKLVLETKGFTGAYFKEIFIISMLRDINFLDAVSFIKKKSTDLTEFKSDTNYMG